jgi:hypothetical protein
MDRKVIDSIFNLIGNGIHDAGATGIFALSLFPLPALENPPAWESPLGCSSASNIFPKAIS